MLRIYKQSWDLMKSSKNDKSTKTDSHWIGYELIHIEIGKKNGILGFKYLSKASFNKLTHLCLGINRAT